MSAEQVGAPAPPAAGDPPCPAAAFSSPPIELPEILATLDGVLAGVRVAPGRSMAVLAHGRDILRAVQADRVFFNECRKHRAEIRKCLDVLEGWS